MTKETVSCIEGCTGEALFIMAKIGATPDQLGQFAVQFPEKIAQRLAPLQMAAQINESKPKNPD